VVIEGPSGIGKTTAIENALEEVGISKNVTKLSARKQSDVEYIQALPEISDVGAVVVDDFHKLNNETRSRLADYMKTLADEEVETVKLIILGINRAGENLISFANDLVNRIDIIPFEANPDEKVDSLIGQGEHALNIRLNVRQEIVREAKGSFYLAQMLAREVCMEASVLERRDSQGHLEVSLPAVRSRVWERLGLSFRQRCESFCTGTRLRKEGRAPYLHILNWLATSSEWTLSLRDAVRQHAELRGSVGQVVEKGYLSEIVEGDPQIRAVLHYDKASEQLTVEDPQFLFYFLGDDSRTIWDSFPSSLRTGTTLLFHSQVPTAIWHVSCLKAYKTRRLKFSTTRMNNTGSWPKTLKNTSGLFIKPRRVSLSYFSVRNIQNAFGRSLSPTLFAIASVRAQWCQFGSQMHHLGFSTKQHGRADSTMIPLFPWRIRFLGLLNSCLESWQRNALRVNRGAN